MISISDPSEFNYSEIPTEPGVYLFKNEKKKIIYIGKAKNLRLRIRHYFSKSDRSLKTKHLLQNIRIIEWIIVDNEVEALLLENKMVKQNKPKYNIDLKDAKTYAYIALSREVYPRILLSRKPSPKLEVFGPYTDGYLRRKLQKLVIQVFKIRVCKKFPKRPCLNFHIDLCSAPCIDKVTVKEYARQVQQARSFLLGNYEEILSTLKILMHNASKKKEYEHAIRLRNQISSIELLTQIQVVDRYRAFNQDVFAFRRVGHKILIVYMGMKKGVLLGKKEYSIDFEFNVEQEFLKEFYHINSIPQEILLNTSIWGDTKEKKILEDYFSTLRGNRVNLILPTEGEQLDLIRLAEKNIELNLDENSVLIDIQTSLNLPSLPRIIECFDISNLGKEHLVSGMVRYKDGNPDKNNYRRFKIKNVVRQNDFASINEVVNRRYKGLINEKSGFPDLIIVDGGAGQVTAAYNALQSLGLQIPLIGLAKKNEEIFLPNEMTPRRFKRNSRMMLFLRKIRDSAHDFSIRYGRKRRQMKIKDEFETYLA